MAGIATLVMSLTAYRALYDTRAQFYGEYRFAEVFARVERAPWPLLEDVRRLLNAGVPVALVSYHYGSKQALYRAIFESWLPSIAQRRAGLDELKKTRDREPLNADDW